MTQTRARSPDDLLAANKIWVAKKLQTEAEFFKRLSLVQQPKILWIGCSDSRVPANEIVGLQPGEMFVHRNVANVVPHSDMNALAVIQYAVEMLSIEHIIVTGHYGCAGIRAALSDTDHGQIDNWLAHIKDVIHAHDEEISALKGVQAREDRLCELNVMTQVRNVAKTSIVQKAWRGGAALTVHGWIYRLADGVLHDLDIGLSATSDLHPAYRIEND